MYEDIDNSEKLDSISKRLKFLIQNSGIKQNHLANKLNLTPSGLHYLLNNNDADISNKVKKIANIFQVNEEWLENGEGSIYQDKSGFNISKVSLYTPEELKKHYTKNINLMADNFIVTTLSCENPLIGISIEDTNFSPKFEPGDRVILEEGSNFKDGEIVLVYLKNSNNLLFKFAYKLDENILLISHEEKSPIKYSPSQGDFIVGIYRECIKRSSTI